MGVTKINKHQILGKDGSVIMSSDPDSFAQVLFDKEKEQIVARIILNKFKLKPKVKLKNDTEVDGITLYSTLLEIDTYFGKKTDRTMISRVWKSLLNCGLLKRKKKGAPATLDNKLPVILRGIADKLDEYYKTWK